MKEFGLKICLFLFLAALFSGRTNELGTVVGSITGTMLLWPLYRKVIPTHVVRQRRRVVAEDPAEPVAE
jgi:hypothetical protein